MRSYCVSEVLAYWLHILCGHVNGTRTFIINFYWDFPHKTKQQIGKKKKKINKILSKKGSLQGVPVDLYKGGRNKTSHLGKGIGVGGAVTYWHKKGAMAKCLY